MYVDVGSTFVPIWLPDHHGLMHHCYSETPYGDAGKVAGARWQGTKALIEEDAEDGTGPQAVNAAEDSGAAELPCLQNAKWKKLAKAALLKVRMCHWQDSWCEVL